MTENEALEEHKKDCRRCRDKACKYGVDCLQKKDIEVYEEIQQYRELGTVEEILKVFNNQQTIIASQHETLKQYRAIGTIEEFKALKEKNEPKKVVGLRKYEGKSIANCPNCNNVVAKIYSNHYCDCCGQKLDWQ